MTDSALDAWLRSVRPSWVGDALCREYSEIEFVPRSDSTSDAAIDVCRACLVRSECLDYALRHDVIGVWGGLTTARRRALAQQLGIEPERLRPPPTSTGDIPCPSCGRRQPTARICGTCRARASRARHSAAS